MKTIRSHATARRTIAFGLPAAALLPACATRTGETLAAAPTTKRPWTDGPAFSIIDVDVRDGRAFGEYVVGHAATIAAARGRFLVAGAVPRTVEGAFVSRRMVVHEWPNAQAFLDWYASDAYRPWRARRFAAASANVLLVQGIASSPASPTVAPAFVVIEVDVRDAAAFGRYVDGHRAGLSTGGGQFLAAGGRVEVIEGGWSPTRLVLHRWRDVASFESWYGSSDYRPWRDLRWSAARTDVLLVEGLSDAAKSERRLP